MIFERILRKSSGNFEEIGVNFKLWNLQVILKFYSLYETAMPSYQLILIFHLRLRPANRNYRTETQHRATSTSTGGCRNSQISWPILQYLRIEIPKYESILLDTGTPSPAGTGV